MVPTPKHLRVYTENVVLSLRAPSHYTRQKSNIYFHTILSSEQAIQG